ncbi:uncharacterized protein (TIGR03905 family) [Hydrogenispora ethanolica]|uniref:ribonucleoside-diphosphate reductase n=1 Tax=Hydrogenispora ethanolica TaxID=1082276 RepID=A0A4R1S2L7_HYDET|nr:TIGR03905 family TSCPD domain-containing protein [Hydrogenispora ethanolica]TCL73269.1 uncharacterized protein (TIGR03905 family) [Hydrogenispora ethanolica]
MENLDFATRGVCSTRIHLTVDKGVLIKVSFDAGCNGNLQGISRLVEGMPVGEVIERLKGIRCSGKSTSCPDQLVQALEKLERAAGADRGGTENHEAAGCGR